MVLLAVQRLDVVDLLVFKALPVALVYVVIVLAMAMFVKRPGLHLLVSGLPAGFAFLTYLFYLESLRLGPPLLAGVPFFGLLTGLVTCIWLLNFVCSFSVGDEANEPEKPDA